MLISELTETDRLVMDTHIWVWATGESGGPGQIPNAALVAIERAAERRDLFVSAASIWEMALKAERGRASVSGDLRTWVQEQRQYPGVRMMPIDGAFRIDMNAIEVTDIPASDPVPRRRLRDHLRSDGGDAAWRTAARHRERLL